MGEIKKYSCKCGYTEEIHVGMGLFSLNTKRMEKIFKADYEKALQKQTNGQASRIYMKNAIVECKKCKKIFNLPELVVRNLDDTYEYYLNTVCSTCGEVVYKCDEEEVACPVCGIEMDVEVIGNWD